MTALREHPSSAPIFDALCPNSQSFFNNSTVASFHDIAMIQSPMAFLRAPLCAIFARGSKKPIRALSVALYRGHFFQRRELSQRFVRPVHHAVSPPVVMAVVLVIRQEGKLPAIKPGGTIMRRTELPIACVWDGLFVQEQQPHRTVCLFRHPLVINVVVQINTSDPSAGDTVPSENGFLLGFKPNAAEHGEAE